jgi:periplasmic copper chaperone A
MSRTRTCRRAAVSGLLATGVLALVAAPASAHVTLTASTTAAGSSAVVVLEVPHGCEGSATTEISVRLPDDVTELSAESNDRWAADPGEGQVTFRTDDPLPDALRDEVAFTVRLPDEVGVELVFPVVQRCQEGESAWTEVAEDDASSEDLDMPAPVIVVTGADGTAADPPRAVGASDGRLMTYGAVGVLAGGCLASAGVLLMRRRRG